MSNFTTLVENVTKAFSDQLTYEELLAKYRFENMRNAAIYGVEGLIILLTNCVIFLPIIHHEALHRKEYILIAGQAFFDSMNGLAYLCSGMRRYYVYSTDTAGTRIRPVDCLTRPSIILWLAFEQSTTLMLCVVGIDRLNLLVKPYFYLNLTTRYAYGLSAKPRN